MDANLYNFLCLYFFLYIDRTRYGIVVSVVDSDHFLISVTIVSPYDGKSPKDRLKGNMNGNGQPRNGASSSCVCLYLSLKEFCFVD